MPPEEYLDMTDDYQEPEESYLERLDRLDMTDDECREEWWRCMECGEEYSYERVTPDVDGWLIRCARCCGGEHD